MRPTPFFHDLAACERIPAAVGLLHDAARERGATSAAFIARRGDGYDRWSTNDPDWLRGYIGSPLARSDPEMRRETRPARARWFLFEEMTGDGADAPFYAEIVRAGFRAGLFMPDPSPAGVREMATVNVAVRAAVDDLAGWIEGPGVELRMMACATILRIRDLRAREGVGASPLTARETEVLTLVARGVRPAAIAGQLGISVRTVEFHLQGARESLDVPTRDAAVARAAARGWIEVE